MASRSLSLRTSTATLYIFCGVCKCRVSQLLRRLKSKSCSRLPEASRSKAPMCDIETSFSSYALHETTRLSVRRRCLARTGKTLTGVLSEQCTNPVAQSKVKKRQTVWMIMLSNEQNVRMVQWISPKRVEAEGAKIPGA